MPPSLPISERTPLHTVELIMALEDEFGLQIPNEDVEGFTTVRQVVDYIVRASHGIADESMRPLT
jgi:hypothetical protein